VAILKSFIIALERCPERFFSTYKKLLNVESLDIEKLNAVDAMSSQAHPLMSRYNEPYFHALNGRLAVPGEIGCYSSHYLAWEKCVLLNQPVIVFEDDVVIDVSLFERAVSFATEHIEECGFIRLENYSNKREFNYVVEDLDDRQKLVRHIKTPLCTTAYMITPYVAKKFMEQSKQFIYPVDVFIRNVWIHKQPTYGISPAGLSGGDGGSVIGDRSSVRKKTLRIKWFKLLSKIRDVSMNGFFNFWFGCSVKKSRHIRLKAK
jgi:glycosyl transferase family 25